MASKLGSMTAASTEVYSTQEVDELLGSKIPYFEGTRKQDETDSAVLARITAGKTVKVGSLAVIKTVDVANTTYTAYRYVSDNGEAPSWKAMNGNYSADVEALKTRCTELEAKVGAASSVLLPDKDNLTVTDLWDVLFAMKSALNGTQVDTPEP